MSVFKDQEAVKCLSSLHAKYVIVPADKASNNIVFVCKSYYFIHNYLEIMFPIDVLRFSEFRTMRNHLLETLMLNDIQITSDYMSRWVALKRRVGAVTSQRVLKVLFYVNNQSVPIVSYRYTNSIGRKIFNYKEALQDINIEEYLNNPLTWTKI
jgi:hypothetical protein